MGARSVVGLDIGTSGIRAAQLSFAGQGATLDQFAQVQVSGGAVRDGEVLFEDRVSEALKSLWNTAKFDTRDVVVGVSNQKVIVRQLDLPYLDPAEMKSALPFQVGDSLPINVEDAILDYYPLTEFENESGVRMQRMLLVAAARDMIDKHVKAAADGGLNVLAVDLTPFALLRSLVSVYPAPNAVDLQGSEPGEAIVDIGSGTTDIVVHGSGLPRFVRILPQGGGTITAAVAQQLNVSVAEAESVKVLSAMPMGGAPHPAAPVVQEHVGEFVEEVRSTLDFYMSQASTGRLSRVVVTGGGALLGGLTARLSAALRMPVEVGQPFQSLTLGTKGKGALSPEQAQLAAPLASAAVGLALGAR